MIDKLNFLILRITSSIQHHTESLVNDPVAGALALTIMGVIAILLLRM